MALKASPPSVVLGLIQMSSSENTRENMEKASARIEEAHRLGAEIICLPELFRSRYFPQTEDPSRFSLAEPIPGPTTDALVKLARVLKVVLIAPVFEKRAPGVYHNTSVVIDADGSLLGKYRKMHIPDDPAFYEKFYFTPGDLGFQVFVTRYARVGVLICWDQWFPEAARLTALRGAQILFYPTAIGCDVKESQAVARSQRQAWEIVQRGHAIANGVYAAVVNRVGVEDGLRFWGGSFVADPFGGMVAKASDRREEILLADCDFEKIDEVRVHWPFLRDRRVDAYGALTERFLDQPESGKQGLKLKTISRTIVFDGKP